MNRIVFASVLFILVAGCSPFRGVKIMDVDNGPHPIYNTTECVSKNPNGECNKKTCKADAESDCGGFAKACLDTGNYYAGTNDAGTCSRVL